MVGSSKILTVKYGTFSCTAEGFEDPLGAVKDTTHFFRHVVRDDRFFGAEPPRFDAALAEELLRGQISADLRDGHLAVRPAAGDQAYLPREAMAGDMTTDGAATDDVPAAEVSETTHDAHPAASESEHFGSDAAAAAEAQDDDRLGASTRTAVTAPAAAPPDAVAEKLARIRAVVGAPASSSRDGDTGGGTAATGHAAADGVDVATDERAAPNDGDVRDDGAVETAPEAQRMVPEVAPEWQKPPNPEQFDRGTPAEAEAHDEITAADDPLRPNSDNSPEPGGRVEFSEVEQEPARLTEGDSAETPINGLDAILAGLRAQVGEQAQVAAYRANDAAPASLPGQDAATAFPASMKAQEADPIPLGAPDAQTADPETVAAVDLACAEENAKEEAAPIVRETEFLSVQDDITGDVAAGDSVIAHAERQPGQLASESPLPSADQHQEEADHDDAEGSAEGDAEPSSGDAPRETAHAPVLGEHSDRLHAESSLSGEDEEELFRELAAVRAELLGSARTAPTAQPFRLDNPILSDDGETRDGGAGDPEIADASPKDWKTDVEHARTEDSFIARASAGARKAVRLASPARALLTERTVGDNDTSRLLDQTDSELDEPEGNRRRSAIAHLRAAVAATRADRALQLERADPETERYREDLAKVVRPRRPKVLRSIRTERPASEPQAAPLQLVSQQRVDDAPAGPVRPRRVNIAEDIGPAPELDAADDAGGGFADYAASVGAARLPDLLEAAAAYMTFVAGRDQFSRPQLMTVLQHVEGGTATREERLRSFGRLLRDGKIEKTRGGRFTASDSIGFRPDARRAG